MVSQFFSHLHPVISLSSPIIRNLMVSHWKLISYDFDLGGRLFGLKTLAEPSPYLPTFWGVLLITT